jgi:hypothetical protein
MEIGKLLIEISFQTSMDDGSGEVGLEPDGIHGRASMSGMELKQRIPFVGKHVHPLRASTSGLSADYLSME